ncbi:hypothetical protein GLOIN_2v1614500 [Rhizophagus irregularis DAOM 181602=DAOM 197198]|nr:hypothetical protein GLOIN_2v1614500 [Rhizophagus irregularis DAOM 181602=DAOM 197198]
MTHQSITLNVNKPQKKIFLSFDIKFNKFTLEEVTIPPYILVKIRFFIHEFCKFYEIFFTLLKNIYYFLYQINKITKKKYIFLFFFFSFFFWHTLILPALENTPRNPLIHILVEYPCNMMYDGHRKF